MREHSGFAGVEARFKDAVDDPQQGVKSPRRNARLEAFLREWSARNDYAIEIRPGSKRTWVYLTKARTGERPR